MYDTALLKQQARDHLWMAYQPPVPFESIGGPAVMVEASGCTMVDSDGKRYLDGIGALEACVAGHCRQELADVAYAQMQKLEFLDVFRYTSPPAAQLAAKLAALAPGDLNRVHYTPGGSEAVETAIKLVKQYQRLIGQTDRYKIITRQSAYHGCTYGAMSVDGHYFGTRTHYYEPLAPFRLISALDDIEELEELIVTERPETIAGLILDPCGVASGVRPPSAQFMRQLRGLCDKYGILLIMDEIIAGFGRTGKMFASEHAGIQGDVMTVSKGLSSGYMPIGAAIVSERVTQAFMGRPDGVFSHGQTYGGHPVACAVALANIELIERERLVERAAEMGAYLQAGLRNLKSHPSFRDVRGLGLVCGLEFTADGDPQQAGYGLRTHCRDLGLITLTVHPGNVIFFSPPPVISHAEVDQLVSIVDRALTLYEEGN